MDVMKEGIKAFLCPVFLMRVILFLEIGMGGLFLEVENRWSQMLYYRCRWCVG